MKFIKYLPTSLALISLGIIYRFSKRSNNRRTENCRCMRYALIPISKNRK